MKLKMEYINEVHAIFFEWKEVPEFRWQTSHAD